jgi:arsenate reductase (thioredoxin)
MTAGHPSPDLPPHGPTVLFLCTGNSARSQMAEALLRHLAGDRLQACSAGIEPKGVHPLTHRVLAELGIDTSGLRSKHVDEFLGSRQVQHVVTVCDAAARNCPSLHPMAEHVLHWSFDDPASWPGGPAARLQKFRAVRDQIRARLTAWLASLDADAPTRQGG